MAKKSVKRVEHKKMEMRSGKVMPLGIRVISVLNYINALFLIIAGVVLLWYGLSGQTIDVDGLTSGAVIVGGVVFIALSILSFYIARGLWKGQNWARVTEAVLGIVAIVSGVMNAFQNVDLVSNIIGIVLNGVIVGYLLLNENVKKAFK